MSNPNPAEPLPPSEWVARFAGLIRDGGNVLDLAAGKGRHSLLLAALGYRVTAVDRDAGVLKQCGAHETLAADLEEGPWPLTGHFFDGIVVTNYLHRPLFPHILRALGEGGVLIYETFAVGNQLFGKPSNPDFLLQPGELLTLCNAPAIKNRQPLHILAYEDGVVDMPRHARVQRICALRQPANASLPLARLHL